MSSHNWITLHCIKKWRRTFSSSFSTTYGSVLMRGMPIAIGRWNNEKTLESSERSKCFSLETKGKIMKPTPFTNQKARQFPLVDYSYHAATLEKFNGRCLKAPKSFRDTTRAYFDIEANRDFLSEAALFATLIVTVAVPIVACAQAVFQLCQTLPL
jgi:hypothetical protein